MIYWEVVIFFILGFLFGLIFRLFYDGSSGIPDQSAKKLRPINKVKYISPKLNEYPEIADKEQEARSGREAVNQ